MFSHAFQWICELWAGPTAARLRIPASTSCFQCFWDPSDRLKWSTPEYQCFPMLFNDFVSCGRGPRLRASEYLLLLIVFQWFWEPSDRLKSSILEYQCFPMIFNDFVSCGRRPRLCASEYMLLLIVFNDSEIRWIGWNDQSQNTNISNAFQWFVSCARGPR